MELWKGFAFIGSQYHLAVGGQDYYVLNGLSRVPQAFRVNVHRLDESHVMAPWQLCNNLLHNFSVTVSLGERKHVFQVPS